MCFEGCHFAVMFKRRYQLSVCGGLCYLFTWAAILAKRPSCLNRHQIKDADIDFPHATINALLPVFNHAILLQRRNVFCKLTMPTTGYP